MSRSKRFIAGTLAGYGNIGANIIFTLLSVPLALAFLDKEQFGLWALAVQINGYLSLIELGMGNAIHRFIADHKDDINGGDYGSHLLTGGLVFISQGFLIAGMGIGFSWVAPSLFSIPANLTYDFRILLILLASFSGLSVATRTIGSPLWAFQRLDVINIGFTVGTILSLAALWFGFNQGWGVFAFPLATIPALILSPLYYFWICRRIGCYPKKNHWGRPKWSLFVQIFLYGKDVFLVQVGNQFLNASQIIIISRFIGLSAAATYAIATKIYGMGMLFLGYPISAAAPGLTELYVRRDYQRFVTRYWDLIKITLAFSTIVAIGIATGNRSFVTLWTNGAIQWPWICDVLLATLIVFKSLNFVIINLFGVAKNWAPVRYLYLTEALVFVPLSIILTAWFGIAGVLAAALLAHLFITAPLATRAARSILGSISQIKKPFLICALTMVCAVAPVWFFENEIKLQKASVFIISIISSICSAIICYLTILPKEVKSKLNSLIRSIFFTKKSSNNF